MLREIGLEKRARILLDRAQSLVQADITWFLVLAGALLLRVREFAAYLPFGNDEAALARNIAERTFSGLTAPLDYNQGAPVLYLFIEKVFVIVFGNKDFVLEIFPFLSSILALYFFYRLVKARLGGAGLAALAAFALAPRIVLYSANPKQYATDIMIALLLVFLSGRCLVENPRKIDLVLLAIVGSISVWLSHPAALVLAGIAVVLVLQHWFRRDRLALIWSLGIGTLWAVTLALDYALSLRHLVSSPYLARYWHSAFMPLPPWSHPRWFVDTYLSLLSIAFNRTDTLFAGAAFLLILIGAWSLLLRQRVFASIILMPFVAALVAALLQKYPAQDRFLLFLVPSVYLLSAEGLSRIHSWLARWNRPVAVAAYVALLAVVLWPLVVGAKRNFFDPPRLWDMRSVVQYIVQHGQPADTILVSGGGETFAYYAGSYGLDTSHAAVDNGHRIIRWGVYKEDLAHLAGTPRAWVVFAYFQQSAEYTRYTKYIARHADVLDTFVSGYARAYLCSIRP